MALLPQIARATALIQAFRDHGHQLARVDPLGSEPPGHPQLEPAFFGTSMEDLAAIPTSLVMEGGGDAPLTETLDRLQRIYCGTIGFQFEHLEDPEKVQWLWDAVEAGTHLPDMDPDERLSLLERLSEVEGLEAFLHRAYLGQKRFSVEGTDMLVPMLDLAIREAARAGATRVVIGMAHRGRINVLSHIIGIPYDVLLREFEGAIPPEGEDPLSPPAGTGDVKYHHGADGEYVLDEDSRIAVTLAPNPSHLEFVNPVVMGMARALQTFGTDSGGPPDPAAVAPVLIHGDAAFAAEGVVAETLNLARLNGYSVGGTVHIIVNNQVGFTTVPEDGRSTRYASDLAKGYDIPILRVNADDPEACLATVRLAMAYRERFHDDVVIDLLGYRRYGHNEGDEPSYTQPLLYQKISEHPTVREQWARRLEDEGVTDAGTIQEIQDRIAEGLQICREEVQAAPENGKLAEQSSPPAPPAGPSAERAETAVSLDRLVEINRTSLELPRGFALHRKLRRQLKRRDEEFGEDFQVDWAHAESLAIGSIVKDDVGVRLTGQDSERGTFSQRHLVLHDSDNGDQVIPLANLGPGRFEIHNSPLSEIAVLGFEYGYSVADPESLVLWEAQFGDFVNAAQVIVDQFIASGRSKWGQLSRLTMLLPHGYEGQGPEHSSARLERFLQLCAEDNLRVAYPSTPAQYFHLLRRQALSEPIRPLVVMTPKSLLRHPAATSPVRELTEGHFRPVVADPSSEGIESDVRRLVLCSGKVYYDLTTADEREDLKGLAVGRIEELYPFPASQLSGFIESFPKLEEVMWVQEEPRNMGALAYIGPRLRSVVPRDIPLKHVSRPERASTAEGRTKNHRKAQEQIVREALGLD
jgi:2-oxoglutarate dehydrogenase E1 component